MQNRANDSHRQSRHISWNEAWSEENQRERARLAACLEIPTAGPVKLFVANVARELPRIKARTLRYLSWKSPRERPSTGGIHTQVGVGSNDQQNYYILRAEPAAELRDTPDMERKRFKEGT